MRQALSLIDRLDVALAKCQRATIQNKYSLGLAIFSARHFFCSQVFKTASNVLNPDVNIVNIALTKLAHWPMSSLLACSVGRWPIVCYSCRLF